LPGFESGDADDTFVAYITQGNGSGSGGSGGGNGSGLFAEGGYRYGFNGKENDNEVKGVEGSQQDYGMRIYDPRIGKFLSVDPLSSEYPWYTPYQFAGNKPIQYVDLDGLEEANSSSGISFFPFLTPRKANTPGAMIHRQIVHGVQNFQNSRAGKFIGGAWNATTGTIGAITSVSYMAGTGGTGAAAGGVVAFSLSVGEVAIGTAQMMDAIFSEKTNDALQNSGSIPGLIAYGTGSKYAPFIDALGQFTPTMAAEGSFKGMVTSGLGVIDAAKTLKNTPNVTNTIALLDQISDTKGFVLESFTLFSQMKKSGLAQNLKYSFSYIVQKGDNLSKIAEKFKTTVDKIMQENSIDKENADRLDVGQNLKFSGITYGGSNFGGGGSGNKY
jgi:RHS repeat-associated protein